jgi:uncharacterized protein YaaN involved in tellurite resistance
MNFKKIIKEIDKHMAAVAKERDELDNFILQLEELKENCTDALENLQCARDSLSELV